MCLHTSQIAAVAQWESTCPTRRGSLVQSQPAAPLFDSTKLPIIPFAKALTLVTYSSRLPASSLPLKKAWAILWVKKKKAEWVQNQRSWFTTRGVNCQWQFKRREVVCDQGEKLDRRSRARLRDRSNKHIAHPTSDSLRSKLSDANGDPATRQPGKRAYWQTEPVSRIGHPTPATILANPTS